MVQPPQATEKYDSSGKIDTSYLLMICKYILTITKIWLGQFTTYNPTYSKIKDGNRENKLHRWHTLHIIYPLNIYFSLSNLSLYSMQVYMMMIMRGSTMPTAKKDFKAIIYHACGTHSQPRISIRMITESVQDYPLLV